MQIEKHVGAVHCVSKLKRRALSISTQIVISLATLGVLTAPAVACEKSVYTIGVQAIDYSPHYNFNDKDAANYFGEYVDWLNKKLPCTFIVKSLPIRRLNFLFEQGMIDFIYPDNPSWHDDITAGSRVYSSSLVTALGGTVVKHEDASINVNEFKRLAFPRGFTPIAWLALQAEHVIEFSETNSALASLRMVLAGRATGADVEWNVAKYIVEEYSLPPIALGKNLPFVPTTFHLASYNHSALVRDINKLMQQNSLQLNAMKEKFGIQESLSEDTQPKITPALDK